MRTLVLALLLIAAPAAAEERLWDLLARGGQVVLLRHAATTPGTGDPAGFRLEDCETQRNLSEAGREQARRLGRAFAERKIPVERVLSSPWCRCLETARLAFGRAEVAPALSNLFGRPQNREKQVEGMKALLAAQKGNVVLVSHGVTISALTDVYLGMGEMVVVTPQGEGRFRVAGRLALD